MQVPFKNMGKGVPRFNCVNPEPSRTKCDKKDKVAVNVRTPTSQVSKCVLRAQQRSMGPPALSNALCFGTGIGTGRKEKEPKKKQENRNEDGQHQHEWKRRNEKKNYFSSLSPSYLWSAALDKSIK